MAERRSLERVWPAGCPRCRNGSESSPSGFQSFLCVRAIISNVGATLAVALLGRCKTCPYPFDQTTARIFYRILSQLSNGRCGG